MGIHLVEGAAVFGIAIALDRFPILFSEFLRRYPGTTELEATAIQLIQNGFSEADIPGFVRRVCGWGGYTGIGARILKRNTTAEIQAAFRSALGRLTANRSSAGRALAEVNKLHGLGTPSFASKHLRFLRPDACPVLDSVLRDALPYSFDVDGYDEFAADCTRLGSILRERSVANPLGRTNGQWFAADVEAALFSHVNEWVPQPSAA